MSWLNSPLLALDTESTGTDPTEARIVQITVGMSVGPGDWHPWTRIVNPGVPIPDAAAKIHGYTDTRVQTEGTTPSAALAKAYATLTDTAHRGIPVVAHNAAYDLTLLDREFRRHLGEPLPTGLVVLDTLVLFRRFDWITGGRSLGKLAARYGITFPAHDAEADSHAALKLMRILCEREDVLPWVDPERLHHLQQLWYPQQEERAYYRRLADGIESDPPGSRAWPYRPALAEVA